MRYEIQDETFHLIFEEDILSTNSAVLKEQIEKTMELPQVASSGFRHFHFDMRNTKMVDSMGLNLLVTIVRNEKNKGHHLSATVSSPHLHRTLLFTRMDKQMKIDLIS